VFEDLPISLNLLFNFSKQATAVVVSNFYKSYSTFHHFRFFATFNLLGYIYLRKYHTNLRKIDAIILVSVAFHEAIFTTRYTTALEARRSLKVGEVLESGEPLRQWLLAGSPVKNLGC